MNFLRATRIYYENGMYRRGIVFALNLDNISYFDELHLGNLKKQSDIGTILAIQFNDADPSPQIIECERLASFLASNRENL